MFGLSPAQLIILLVVILLIFGTKKLRNAGSDLGAAVKGFKKAMKKIKNTDSKLGKKKKNFKKAMKENEKVKDAEFKSIDNETASAKKENIKEKEQA